jgi:serine/threonine protein kinase
MALSVGTRLGAYEITGTLGAGGMGEVYRATDTDLKRDVAIKILPSAVAEDADRLARFQREAEVLASLNHPNIAQIYGLERSDGTTALVMELVEGPTLADRIAQGPIPPDEALHIARQIADALEAAHSRSIVHRDLKPANIKLVADCTVKVLDFGIAKAFEAQAGISPANPTSRGPTKYTFARCRIPNPAGGRSLPVAARFRSGDRAAMSFSSSRRASSWPSLSMRSRRSSPACRTRYCRCRIARASMRRPTARCSCSRNRSIRRLTTSRRSSTLC